MNANSFAAVKTLVLAAALGLSLAGPARAQASFDEAKLEAFVTAAVAVGALIDQWLPRIKSAESQEAADRLRAQANAELVAVIDRTDGISVDEYKAINDAARSDPALSARIEGIYQQMTKQ
ncbi:MAG: DUF4168 domain-containing protein [Kiloniellaceae bacterium]